MNSISFPHQRGSSVFSPNQSEQSNKTELNAASSRPGWDGESASVSFSNDRYVRTDAYSKTGQYTGAQEVYKTDSAKAGASVNASTKAWNSIRPQITEHDVYGQVIGDVKLSDKASDYLKSLKSKFGNLDFVVVGKDQLAAAKANAASYGNKNHMVVLIDEEKLERMATDENFRKKYEAIISQAANGGSKLSSIAAQNPNIKKIGITTGENGAASFVAACAKNNQSVSDRVAKKREEKKAQAKAEKKHAEKKHAEERLHEKIEERRHHAKEMERRRLEGSDEVGELPDEVRERFDRKIREMNGKQAISEDDMSEYMNNDDYEIITADSMEELIQKLEAYNERTGYGSSRYGSTPHVESAGSIMDYQA